MVPKSYHILKQLQHQNGLLSAAGKQVSTGYNLAWLRDNVYAAMGFAAAGDTEQLVKSHHALLDVLLRHEYKIDHAIIEKPQFGWQYIHARYHPETLDELPEEWGNKQNDAIGAILFSIGTLEAKGVSVLRGRHDRRVLQKLVWYLESIQYWCDADNGMWEEKEEVHASSVGACVAGLAAVSSLVTVPPDLVQKGKDALNELLPRESASKFVDLSLLSLVWPYNVVSAEQKAQILYNVENYLVRERGVIRYWNDQYYWKNGEAEWTFGFPWLAIIFRQIGDKAKYDYYLAKTESVMNKEGELPELYFANTATHNENSPLAWSQALYMVAVSG